MASLPFHPFLAPVYADSSGVFFRDGAYAVSQAVPAFQRGTSRIEEWIVETTVLELCAHEKLGVPPTPVFCRH